jgi:hypothetical protein
MRLMITSILHLKVLHSNKCNLYLWLKQDHQVKLNISLYLRNKLYLQVQLNSKNHWLSMVNIKILKILFSVCRLTLMLFLWLIDNLQSSSHCIFVEMQWLGGGHSALVMVDLVLCFKTFRFKTYLTNSEVSFLMWIVLWSSKIGYSILNNTNLFKLMSPCSARPWLT